MPILVTQNSTNNNNTITVDAGGGQLTDIFISKCTVFASGDLIYIYWDDVNYLSYTFDQFDPSYGSSADEVEAYIAGLLFLPSSGGGGVSGSGALPQIAYWTGASSIGGSSSLVFGKAYGSGLYNAIGIGISLPANLIDGSTQYNGEVAYSIYNKTNASLAKTSVIIGGSSPSQEAVKVGITSIGFTATPSGSQLLGNYGFLQSMGTQGFVFWATSVSAVTTYPFILAYGGNNPSDNWAFMDGVSKKSLFGAGAVQPRGSGYLQVIAGGQTTASAQVGGVLKTYTDTVTATTTEIALYSTSIFGDTFLNIGDSVEGEYTISSDSDNMLAINSLLTTPSGLVVDGSGNVYIADSGNNKIRFVDIGTGIITTFAGAGTAGYSGDGNLAINAQLNNPFDVALNAAGTILYIADSTNNVIRAVNISTGIISTFAGTGVAGFSGDSGAATSAQLNDPNGVAVDSAGNVYIADTGNDCIRVVSITGGNINTFAGQGTVSGNIGDTGAATSALLYAPQGVDVSSTGVVYIADTGNNRIRTVVSGIINNFAGDPSGGSGSSGDGGLATSAFLDAPQDVCVDGNGNTYIADTSNTYVRKVTAGIISAFAGQANKNGNAGDGGASTSATLNSPSGVASGVGINPVVYIGDTGNTRVRNNVFGGGGGYDISNFAGNADAINGYYFNSIANLYFGTTGSLFGGSTGDASITNGSGGVGFQGVIILRVKATMVSSSELKIAYEFIQVTNPNGGTVAAGGYVIVSYTNGAALSLTQPNYLTLTGYGVVTSHITAPQINAVMGSVEWKSAN